MNLELLPLSFAAGIATFFSPCFGAMLPAYVSAYLGKTELPTSWWAKGKQGLALGGITSAGFLTSFLILGILFSLVGTTIARFVPWFAVFIGVGIVISGIVMVIKPNLSFSFGGIASKWFRPTLGNNLYSFYFYGLIYAVCAAACTLPIFLSVMMQTFINNGIMGSLVNFIAYGWGMSIMMLAFSITIVYSKGAISRFFPIMTRIIHRISGVFMILAGGYVLYYLLIYGRYLDDLMGR